MPYKKIPCPQCGQPKSAKAKTCRACLVPYERTPEWRAAMSARKSGIQPRGTGWTHSPETVAKMKSVWTEERREAKRKEVLARNPQARYHGLSSKEAARLVRRIGRCERCQHDGSESRLGVHHKNRDKHDQRLENLEVLCHRCHMQEHASAGETGFDSMWRKRKTIQDSTKASRPVS